MRLIVLALCALSLPAQPNYRIDTLAGADPINDGGPATEAYLTFPDDVAVHPDGGFLIADRDNNLVRRVAADGTISTIAGYRTVRGDQDVALEISVFPRCVAASPDGRIFFCTSSRILEILPNGRLSTFAGSTRRGYEGDGGPATDAQLRFAEDMAVAPDGTAYIADSSSDTIRAVAPDGTISTIAGRDLDPGFSGDGGPATDAQINDPAGLSVAPDGALVFVDVRNARIRRIGTDGVISTIAGTGERGTPAEEQPALEANLPFLSGGLAVTAEGEVVFSEQTRAYRIGGDGLIRRFAGNGNPRSLGDDGPATDASLFSIEAIAVGLNGETYLLERISGRVRVVDSEGVIRTAAGRSRFSPEGPANEIVLYLPNDVAEGGDGSIYFTEPNNEVVRRLAPDGTVSTFAGTGRPGRFGDGGPAADASLFRPWAVAYDPLSDSVYIVDRNNNRVRRVDSEGNISTFAGGVGRGTGGDGGPATEAEFVSLTDVQVGPDGRVYLCDLSGHNVRVVDGDGIITRVAGTGEQGGEGDGGPAVDAQLSFPSSLLIGPDGSVYIADGTNRAVRRVTPDGMMETFVEPTFPIGGMVLESDGVLLLTNSSSSYIERWTPGQVARDYVAGLNAGFGFFGDGGDAEDAALRSPRGMIRTRDGRIVFADEDNHRIRVLEESGEVSPPAISNNGIVQAASFFGGRMASDTIVSVFGENLAVRSEAATATPLPTRLGGSEADVTDSAGTTRPAQYFFASPGQLNLLIPTAMASGDGLLRVTTAGGVSEVPLGINRDAPGLFSANANGQGVAAAVWQLVRADGSRESGFTFEFDAGQSASVATPIPLGAEGDELYLTLFGTGLRNASTMRVTIDGQDVPVLFFGAQPDFAGLDQINVGPIPRELAGRTVTVQAASQGRGSNNLTITLQ